MAFRTKQTLIGCGIGCGLILLVATGSCIGFVWWVKQPGDVLAPQVLVGADTTGYVEWTLRLEDPGTREFVERGLENLHELRRQVPTPLPPALDSWIVRQQERSGEEKMRRLFPVVLAWTLHPGAGQERDLQLFSASLSGADHQLVVLDWILGFVFRRANRDARAVEHAGERIYVVPLASGAREAAFFIHRGDAFFAFDLENAKRAVERLAKPEAASPGSTDLRPWLDRAPDEPLRGAVSNAHGEVRRLWREWLGEEEALDDAAWSALGGLTLGGVLTAEGRFEGALELHFDGEAAAALAEGPLRETIDRAVAGTPFDLKGVERRDGVLRVALSVTKLADE